MQCYNRYVTLKVKNKSRKYQKYNKIILTTKFLSKEGISYEQYNTRYIDKQSVVKYSFKHGVTKAAIKFKMHRKTIYRWREKYDGTAQSLKNKSRRPHSHPNQHTKEEIKLIKNYKNKNKETGLVVLWIKLRKVGYRRSITSLYRVMQRIGIYNKAPSKKKEYEPKAYEEMRYPGERVQVDVKYVPAKSLTKEVKEKDGRYYQYTAIDEYTRKRVLWASKERRKRQCSRINQKNQE